MRYWLARRRAAATLRSTPPASPAYAADFADPFVLRTAGAYYAWATQTGRTNVQVITSVDLTSWRHLGDALPSLPAWAAPGWTWSPSVLERDGRYLLYYCTRHAESGRQAISVATGDRPEGPFDDASSRPFIFQLERGGSIDPSPFVDDDGTAYLLWKSEENAIQQASNLWAAALSPDGLSLSSEPVCLLGHDRRWERPLIEAPSMVRADDSYVLFYSGNWWESHGYAIGYAMADAPLSPCHKTTRRRAWVATREGAAGPGGQEFFTDADGGLWMAYHAWTDDKVGYAVGGARALWLNRVEFVGGRPILH